MDGIEIVIAIVGLMVGWWWLHKRRAESREPLRWPLLGMLPYWIMHVGHAYDWITEILNNCGGTFLFQGPKPLWSALFTSDPENVEYILKTKFTSFPKGPLFRSIFRDLLGHGIFNADGESWTVQRRATVAEFNSKSSLNYAMKSIEESVDGSLIRVLDAACSEGRAVDLQDVFLRFTFDNVCDLAFGTRTGCLSPELPDVPFARAFEEATAATSLRFFLFFTPKFLRRLMKHLGVGNDVRLQREMKTIDSFVANIISSRRQEFNRTQQKLSAGRSDLLSIFMSSRDENGEVYSDKYLRDVCINFILAGRDTSSVAMSWFFWLLLRHPHVEQNILHEINTILEERSDYVPGKSLCFTREELKRMHYLQASLTEAMRLYPPVPMDLKQAMEDVVLPNGTLLKKGMIAVYSIYSMGRMVSVWGENCKEFKPERWLNNGSFVSQSAYKFTAFNGGPRMCLGKDFAYLQMKYAVATILHRFRLRMVGPLDGVRYKLGLTLYIKKGMHITLHRREETAQKLDKSGMES